MNTWLLFGLCLVGFVSSLGVASTIERYENKYRTAKWLLYFFRSFAMLCAFGVLLSLFLFVWGGR